MCIDWGGMCMSTKRQDIKKIQVCLGCRTKSQYNFKKAVYHSNLLGMKQFILIFHPLSNTFKNFICY